jgi:D-alanyl-D-alanine carboxypeptidase/D-alanyl-D-alanine-endopeptidase (penicillin-binding protein 4)
MLINDNFINGPLPNNAQRLFTHLNSRTLEQIILSMLEFSNNFIANQLYLLLGAEVHHAPATMDKSYSVFANYIQQHFEWEHYVLVEGAGLSTQNRLSAQQLIDVLNSFKPYKHLMPMQNSQILAKSGTLKHVSTYTGYLNHSEHWSSFALMINQKIPYNFRKQVATELLK